MSIKLRDYQEKLISDIRQGLTKHRSLIACSPCGSGKTATTAAMLKGAIDKNKIAWFVVHRQELMEQSIKAFNLIGLDHGIVAAGYNMSPSKQVQICMEMSLVRRLHKLPLPNLIVWDECQLNGANTRTKIKNANPQAFNIGLSASPWRLDGKPMSAHFESIVYGPKVKWLIDNKFLCDYKLYAPTDFSTENISIKQGDYDMKQVEALVSSNKIVGDFYLTWQKHAFNKQTIVFAPTILTSQTIVDEFNKNGITAKHLDGETPSHERQQTLRDYAAGRIKVISNVRLFTEGFDCPTIGCVMLARPTKSLALYLQMVGRGLRPEPSKEHLIILDMVNSCVEHGLPDDDREWSLDGRKKKKKSDDSGPEESVKVCKTCFSANNNFNMFCINCGAKFEIKERKQIEQVDGELTEVDKEKLRTERKKLQGQAKTLEDLIKIGIERNYKNPRYWAMSIIKARSRR